MVTIIIPVHNEEKFIPRLFYALEALLRRGLSAEVIIVDDGSTDSSLHLMHFHKATMLKPDYVKIIVNENRQGKGASLRAGLHYAQGDIIVFFDADLEYDAEDIPRVAQEIKDNKCEACFGSRFLNPLNNFFPSSYLANKLITFTTNLITRLNLTDIETGLKAFRAQDIKKVELKENSFTIEPEIVIKLSKMRCRIKEIAIGYRPRDKAQGKKVRWYDGIHALMTIARLAHA